MSYESVAIGLLLVLSAFIFAVSLAAYLKSRSGRMALVAMAFLATLLKAALLTMFLFAEPISARALIIATSAADCASLALLYIGVLKR